MAETSRSQVTITLGRTGQVVKRPGPVLDSAFSHSQEGLGSKRSVRDRLGGSNGDSSQLSNKRLRVDNTRLTTSAANSVDDTRLGRDDLRFKIMQKNKQTQSNGQQNGVDLREMLSRPARPSTKSLAMQQHDVLDPRSGRHQMPELKDVRHRLPETKDVRLRVPEPDGVRQLMPEATNASILGRAPHMRTADALPQLVDLRSSYSTWTLEHLRQRSPDGVLGTSRGISPPRNGEEMQRRPLMRSYDDVRTVPYMGKDVLKVSRPMGTASFMAKPTLSAAPTKAVAPLLTPPLSGVIQKSSYAVDEQHTVEGFLNSLGLEKYYISFRAEEVDMTALRQMGDNDLKELGIPMVYFHSPASHIFEIMIVFVVSLCVFSYYLCSPAISFFAEFYAFMVAVEEAYKRGWRKLLLEMDSDITLRTFFNKEFVAPWKIRQRWLACHTIMADMQIRCSHIFREGNVPDDIVSNVALLYPNFTWWSGIIPEIRGAVIEDRIDRPKFRFC